MGSVVGAFGVTHNPLLWRFLTGPELPEDLVGVRDGFARLAAEVAALRPDAVIVVGTDHMTQLATDLMPAFLVGKAARFPAIFWNETREFGIPGMSFDGHPELARHLLGHGLATGFDLAFSDGIRLDHAFALPHRFLVPDGGVPIVPLFTNCIAPPFPPARRFLALGGMLAEAVEATPDPVRVVVVASGHLSVEVGGPRQFSGAPDPAFDAEMTALLGSGRVDDVIARCTPEQLTRAGNVTHQFMNFLVAAGAVGGAAAATAVPSRFTASPFYRWG